MWECINDLISLFSDQAKGTILERGKKLKLDEDLQKVIQDYMDEKENQINFASLSDKERSAFSKLSNYVTSKMIVETQELLVADSESRKSLSKKIQETCLSFSTGDRLTVEYIESIVTDVTKHIVDFYISRIDYGDRVHAQMIITGVNSHIDEVLAGKGSISQQELPESRISPFDMTKDYLHEWSARRLLLAPRGLNITLEKVYQDPPIKILDDLSSRTACSFIIDMLNSSGSDHPRMLSIFGSPGYGKSSLISSILGSLKKSDSRLFLQTQVYKFSHLPCLQNITADSISQLPAHMLHDMKLQAADLNNSIIILDGLDEVNLYNKFSGNPYVDFLNALHDQWIDTKLPTNAKLIITCRSSRIPPSDRDKLRRSTDMCDIELQPLNEDAISKFALSFWGYENKNQLSQEHLAYLHGLTEYAGFNSPQNNLSVSKDSIVGVPLILTMLLAQEIPIHPEMNYVSIYQHFFSVQESKTSIYYRNLYGDSHIITSHIAELIHDLSLQVAGKIWLQSDSENAIAKSQYDEIAQNIIKVAQARPSACEEIKRLSNEEWHNLSIGQFFTEGKSGYEILFLHRSMYEYFAALYFVHIFQTCYNYRPSALFREAEDLSSNSISSDNHVNSFLNLVLFLSRRLFSSEPEIWSNICELLQLYSVSGRPIICDKYWEWWQDFFKEFQIKGLSHILYHAERGPTGLTRKQELLRDSWCFDNLMYIICDRRFHEDTWAPALWGPDDVPIYLKYSGSHYYNGLNLRNVILSDSILSWTIFKNSTLAGANFHNTVLSNSIFLGCDLSGAQMICTNLISSHLQDTNLSNAQLSSAVLFSARLLNVDLTSANLTGTDLAEAVLRDTTTDDTKWGGTITQYAKINDESN